MGGQWKGNGRVMGGSWRGHGGAVEGRELRPRGCPQCRQPPEPREGLSGAVVADAPRPPALLLLEEVGAARHRELLCTVDSRPPAQLLLLRGRTALGSTRDASARAAPNALRVRVEARGAAGQYVCVANNSLGTSNTSMHLRDSGECGTAGTLCDHCGVIGHGYGGTVGSS